MNRAALFLALLVLITAALRIAGALLPTEAPAACGVYHDEMTAPVTLPASTPPASN